MTTFDVVDCIDINNGILLHCVLLWIGYFPRANVLKTANYNKKNYFLALIDFYRFFLVDVWPIYIYILIYILSIYE